MSATHWLGIAESAAAFADRSLSPVELMRDLLVRIERLDPELNAFIRLDGGRAMSDAAKAERELAAGLSRGSLHGVPVGIKDVVNVAGQPTTCHSKLRLASVARADAAVVARLRAAGAIILGKLATHEFAIGGPAFDLPFPPARNPWNPACHPGGSSSGAGAAVAAGLLPGAVGTDTAGSIRNPASACGIVGLKPTYGLVPRDGVFPLAFSLDHVGPLTRSVADAALMLDAMSCEPGSGRDLVQGATGLRIGFVRHFHESDLPCDPEVGAALETVARALMADGATVSAVTLPSLVEFNAVNRVILAVEGFSIHARDLRERPEDYAEITRRVLLTGAFLSAEDYVAAMRRRTQMIAAVDAAFADVDILLTASSLFPPCAIDDAAEIQRTYLAQARTPFNLTGHPALAMMAGLSSGGMPLSVQFAARRFEEATLLRVAAAWERAMGGPRRPPID